MRSEGMVEIPFVYRIYPFCQLVTDNCGLTDKMQSLIVQTSLREVILPPDFWTLSYLMGESPTSIWSNFPAGVTTLRLT